VSPSSTYRHLQHTFGFPEKNEGKIEWIYLDFVFSPG